MGYLFILTVGLVFVAILAWQHATWEAVSLILTASVWATWKSFRNCNRPEPELPDGTEDPYEEWWKE